MSDKTELDLDAERASFEAAHPNVALQRHIVHGTYCAWVEDRWQGWLAARRATIQPTAAEAVGVVYYDTDDHNRYARLTRPELCKAGDKLYTAPVAPADAVRDAENKDTARLDFVLKNTAFITWVEFDSTFKRAQLWSQDEDEGFHVLSGDDKSFATEREAIDAAMKSNAQKGGV